MESGDKMASPSAAPLRMFCRRCDGEATERCDDEHHEVVSLRRARAQDAGPVLAALQRAEEGLDKLGEALGNCLEQERAGLAAARARLQEAMGASTDAWEQAKQAAEPTALSRSASQLAAELVDPAVSCTVAVRRGPTVLWTADLRPADHAEARLLLGRLACGGALGVHSAPARRPVGRSPKEAVGSSPKKPRGRPRKKLVGSPPKRPVGSFPEKPVGSSAKKPRGRPPKESVGSSAKKPRGRPPKRPVGGSLRMPLGSSPETPLETPHCACKQVLLSRLEEDEQSNNVALKDKKEPL